MKYKSTLILLVAVAIAGVVAYSLSKKPTSDEIARTRKRLLPDFRTADVKQLTVESPGRRLVCRRESADDWRIVEPLNVRADRWQVEGILDKLETAQRTYIPEEQAAAAYGLKEPVRTVIASLDETGKPAWTLRIGNPTGVGDTVFVSVEGQDGVFAVAKDVADKTAATLTGLRSKALIPRISSFDLEALVLSAPDTEIDCRRAGERWEMAVPVGDLADRGAIEALASKLSDHRVADDDFIVDDPTKAAQYGLDEPALTVMLTGKGKPQTVSFARKGEGDEVECYALTKGEPAIMSVPASLLDALEKGPHDLRERTLADFRPEEVAEVAVSGAPGDVLLKKQGNAWQVDDEAADADAVDALLNDLKGLEVRDFVADEPSDLLRYGLADDRAVSVTVRDADGQELAAVSFGGPDEASEAVYVRRNAYAPVLAVPRGDYRAALGRGRVAFLDRRLLDEPRSAARRIVLARGQDRFECAWKPGRASWDLVKPAGGPADRYAVQNILGDLSPLRAATIVAEEADDLTPYGLDAPAIVLEVSYESTQPDEGEAPQPRVRTIQVGADTKEPAVGCFARLADDKRVFVLTEDTVKHLRAELASRDLCRAPEPTGLTFQMGERTLAFAYDGDKQTWTNADGTALGPEVGVAVDNAAVVLNDLRADSVADYVEKSETLYGFDKPYLTVTVDEATTKGKRVVIGGPVPGGGRYAKGPETGYVDVISDGDAAILAAVLMPLNDEP